MASAFSHILVSFLSLVVVVVLIPFSSATTSPGNVHDHLSLSSITSSFPRLQAEKLIRDLNLFPDDDINLAPVHDPSAEPSKIVEKSFKFPFIDASSSSPSVGELGHHAGYYRLPHSKAAR